ncbi:hypothetical protein [Roseibium sp. MB-4]
MSRKTSKRHQKRLTSTLRTLQVVRSDIRTIGRVLRSRHPQPWSSGSSKVSSSKAARSMIWMNHTTKA